MILITIIFILKLHHLHLLAAPKLHKLLTKLLVAKFSYMRLAVANNYTLWIKYLAIQSVVIQHIHISSVILTAPVSRV